MTMLEPYRSEHKALAIKLLAQIDCELQNDLSLLPRYTYIDPINENLLTVLPFIGHYVATHSDTVYIARTVFNRGNIRSFLNDFYRNGGLELLDFPLMLYSKPTENAIIFNERLGFRYSPDGLFCRYCQSRSDLPLIRSNIFHGT
jgi:hypothetical protein